MCPWTDWQPASLKFCEELLCSAVRQPANTYSNIGFVIMGLLILWREGKGWSPYHLMGIAGICIGITSGVYHASMTFFWQFFDVSSMFMLILLALTFNLIRIGWVKEKFYTLTYVAMLLTSMGLMLLIQGKSGEWIFAVEVAIVTVTEFLIAKKGSKPNYTPFIKALGVFLLAFLIWTGDIRGWWCDPRNHILQGHAAWHLLNAVSAWYLYKFYKQFQKTK
ncbi:MAG: ceramidase [Bacteriovoracaceae bacterium]|nr:ceramidase [Bacteriovoracaceae bacterium]